MSQLKARSFESGDLDALNALVSHEATKRWPEPGYLMTSDVAWRLPFADPQDIRMWVDAEGLAAYAWFTANDLLCFGKRDDAKACVFDKIFAWAEEKAVNSPAMNPWLLDLTSMEEWTESLESGKHLEPGDSHLLYASAFDADDTRKSLLEQKGFEATNHTAKHLKLVFNEPIAAPTASDGTTFRHVDEDELEKRCELHRRAWLKSSFTLDQYNPVRKSPIYESTLDVVSVDSEGNFGSYCIGWIDRDMGVGSFEPVGTHANFRKQGLAEKVIQETLRRMQTMGMKGAKISTAGFNDPAFNLYQRCGFEFTDLERTYIKRLDQP